MDDYNKIRYNMDTKKIVHKYRLSEPEMFVLQNRVYTSNNGYAQFIVVNNSRHLQQFNTVRGPYMT